MSSRSRSRPKGRSAYHHHNLSPVLLKAAEELLEKQGPLGLSLREVARRAGVSHNAPYRHFRDRDALLAVLAAHGFAMLRRTMSEAAQAQAAPQSRRGAMGRAYIRFALDHPGMFRLMFSGLLDPKHHIELAQSSRGAFEILTSTFTPNTEASPEALRAWGLVHGIAYLLLDRQIVPPTGATPETLIDTILAGRQERAVSLDS